MARPPEGGQATESSSIGTSASEVSSVRWSRIGLRLVTGTMAYNAIEAVSALWSGTRAGSVALVGFGLIVRSSVRPQVCFSGGATTASKSPIHCAHA